MNNIPSLLSKTSLQDQKSTDSDDDSVSSIKSKSLDEKMNISLANLSTATTTMQPNKCSANVSKTAENSSIISIILPPAVKPATTDISPIRKIADNSRHSTGNGDTLCLSGSTIYNGTVELHKPTMELFQSNQISPAQPTFYVRAKPTPETGTLLFSFFYYMNRIYTVREKNGLI